MYNYPLKFINAPYHCPIVALSYHYMMKIVSVILLQNKKHVLLNTSDRTKDMNGILYSENAKKYVINYLCN